ncbi:hypothetical protein PISMIDRAFT_348068 [Pisolithus microcarpus 441]|uniref:Uncharacterized protein n=1 Tax=Pisolithus microcarpus 441 TaxID=765257 RepID=A0A0C9XQN8_9AGAM|nr:hypothetical protein PISMIDRAFT_348068 [Pisolithus microcarpus 441]
MVLVQCHDSSASRLQVSTSGSHHPSLNLPFWCVNGSSSNSTAVRCGVFSASASTNR